MRTNYSFGAALERQVMKELEKYGYWTMRSSASHGLVDVVAMREPDDILFVQCKRNGRLDPGEWNELFGLAQRLHAKALLVLKKDSGIGNRYWRLLGEKRRNKRTQPVAVWIPAAPGQGALWNGAPAPQTRG